MIDMQVKRAERQMLEELYGHMSGLQSFEKETLMDEEPEIKQRRAAVKQVVPYNPNLIRALMIAFARLVAPDQYSGSKIVHAFMIYSKCSPHIPLSSSSFKRKN